MNILIATIIELGLIYGTYFLQLLYFTTFFISK